MYPDAEMQTIWTLGWLALPSMNVTPLAHSHGVSEQCGALTGWEWSELTRVPVAFDGWAYTQGRAHRPCLGHAILGAWAVGALSQDRGCVPEQGSRSRQRQQEATGLIQSPETWG